MKLFLRWMYPLILGVVMFNTIRLVTDLPNHNPFWAESKSLHVIALLVSVLVSYGFDFKGRYYMEKVRAKSFSVTLEYTLLVVYLFLSVNLILYAGDSIGILYMGDKLADYVIANVVCILYFFLYYILIRNDKLEKEYNQQTLQLEKIKVDQLEIELKFLRAQYHPHFLFNALESIRMHSVIRKEKITAEMVEKLAVMQRQYVDWGEDLIEVGKEMEIVKNYMELQQYRFGKRLSYRLDVETECQHQKIPKLTIVTFAENACVHGIEKKTAPGWIFITVYRENEEMCIEVEDTGEGMTEKEFDSMRRKMKNASIELLENEKGVGIINACLRLKMMSHDRVQFELNGEEGTGVSVLIRLPFIESEKG